MHYAKLPNEVEGKKYEKTKQNKITQANLQVRLDI